MDLIDYSLCVLFVLGAALLFLARAKGWPGAKWSGWLLLGICAIDLLSSSQMTITDGGYSQCEIQLTFVDETGKPVEGVELRVEDRQGNTWHYYPVTDYLPEQPIRSDNKGLLVCHHVANGMEFSGRIRYHFFVLPVHHRPSPVFMCRFLHEGREVHAETFSALHQWVGSGDKETIVKVAWSWPPGPLHELQEKQIESSDWIEQAHKIFDRDGNGVLDPEEAAAFRGAWTWDEHRETLLRLSSDHKSAMEELEFAVVRKTLQVKRGPP